MNDSRHIGRHQKNLCSIVSCCLTILHLPDRELRSADEVCVLCALRCVCYVIDGKTGIRQAIGSSQQFQNAS
jgi:hypothetical protein